jgi:hypothetical protein
MFTLVEEVFLQCVPPALGVDLLLKVDEEVMVVLLLTKVCLEALGLVHVVDDGLFEGFGRALVRYVHVVGLL